MRKKGIKNYFILSLILIIGMICSVLPIGSMQKVYAADKKVILLGDSRTVGLYATLHNSAWQELNRVEDGDKVWIAKVGMGYSWFEQTGMVEANTYLQNGNCKLVILMGANDVYSSSNADKYLNYLKSNEDLLTTNGNEVYFASVGPMGHNNGGSETNYKNLSNSESVEPFNTKIRSGLPSGMYYMDLYSKMTSEGYSTADGLHYDNNTNKSIYNMIENALGDNSEGIVSNGDAGSGSVSNGTTGDKYVDALVRAFFGDSALGGGASYGNRETDENGVPKVPYINQGSGVYELDPPHNLSHTDLPSATFSDGSTIAEAGCGYCSTAMALSYILGRLILPTEFINNGQYSPGAGSYHTVGTYTAASYGVQTKVTNDIDSAYQELQNGNLVMAIEQPGSVPGLPGGSWTNCGHFILLIGITADGNIAVNDSGSTARTYWMNGKVGYTKSQIDMRCSSGAGIKYTVFVVPDAAKGDYSYEKTTEAGKAIVAACSQVPSPGMGYCAKWVAQVYSKAGQGYPTGNACDMYDRLPSLTSEQIKNRQNLEPGMAIALRKCNGGADAQTYGHIGIYIGNGKVMDNVGSIETTDLDVWLSKYCPSGILPRWGYL